MYSSFKKSVPKVSLPLKALKSDLLFSFPRCSHSKKLCPIDMVWDSNKCKCVLQEENPLAGMEGNDGSSEIIMIIKK